MLTLDPTTLFYWTLSDPPAKKMKYSVKSWVKMIPTNAKPASCATSRASCATSRANSVKTGKASTVAGSGKRHSSTTSTPTLMSANTLSCCAITINDHSQLSQAVKIKQNHDVDAIYTYDGALSDCEEITGIECNAAHASPIKGRRHLEIGTRHWKKTQSVGCQQKIQEWRPSMQDRSPCLAMHFCSNVYDASSPARQFLWEQHQSRMCNHAKNMGWSF